MLLDPHFKTKYLEDDEYGVNVHAPPAAGPPPPKKGRNLAVAGVKWCSRYIHRTWRSSPCSGRSKIRSPGPSVSWQFMGTKIDPQALQNAIFYYIRRARGGDEQRQLEPLQFVKSTDCYTYYERLKNIIGSIKELNKEYKVVPCPAISTGSNLFLDLYLKKLPAYASEEDALYCRPKSVTPGNDGRVFLWENTWQP